MSGRGRAGGGGPPGATAPPPLQGPERDLQRAAGAAGRGGGALGGVAAPGAAAPLASLRPREDEPQHVNLTDTVGAGAVRGAGPAAGAAPARPPSPGSVLQPVDPAAWPCPTAPGGEGAASGAAGPSRPAPGPRAPDAARPAELRRAPSPTAPAGQTAPRDYADRVPFPDVLSLRPVAVMRSPFRERHGTPRQGVVDDQPLPPAEGEVVLLDDIPVEALSDLAGFTRVWLLGWMHLNNPAWSPMVRPPRGGQRRGVFATRSPHRPNPIALSCVELVGVEGRRLRVRGHDLIDGTPILDIKPYLPFADAFPGAAAGWVDALPRGPDGRPLGPRLKRP